MNNLVTVVSNDGRSFIIDGKKLKSVNQWTNKQISRLQSIRDKQHLGKKYSNQQHVIMDKRNRFVNDYMNKVARMIVNYCITHDIGSLVVGYNGTFINNQNFVNIPFGRLRFKLEYLCQLNDIVFVMQEESYTSKASFWDNDVIPAYNADNPKSYNFSGKRIKRGLYKTGNGCLLNSDVNGALNIMKKSSVVDLSILY